MKVLIVSTSRPSLRDEIWGWGFEDSDLFVPDKPIGLTPGPLSRFGLRQLDSNCSGHEEYHPKTVLEALANGWKLLGPPQLENIRPKMDEALNGDESWAWWLVK